MSGDPVRILSTHLDNSCSGVQTNNLDYLVSHTVFDTCMITTTWDSQFRFLFVHLIDCSSGSNFHAQKSNHSMGLVLNRHQPQAALSIEHISEAYITMKLMQPTTLEQFRFKLAAA